MQMKSLVKSLGATPSAVAVAGALVLVVPVLPAQANDTVQLSAAARGRILNKADSQINVGTQTENVNPAWDQISGPAWDQITGPAWDQITGPAWDHSFRQILLGRKVHLMDSFSLPNASQSSTANSTIKAPLSPRQTLHATQPVSRSP
jgi:hypothetical protein